MRTIEEFRELNGSELSAVCFVRDYVEFHFDGPILRSFAWPILLDAGSRYEFPQPGAREGLCGLIGRVVEGVQDASDRLIVRLAGDAVIEIPKASPGAGPEIAQFVPIRDGAVDIATMEIWENLLPTGTESSGLERK